MRHDPLTGGEPIRVLLVEDDGRGGTLTVEMLRSGWPNRLVLTQVTRLADATQELLDHGASCVLLAPGGEPAALLAAVEQLCTAVPELPVVVLLAEPDDALSLAAIGAGAEDCLVKPALTPTMLRQAILHAHARKRNEVKLVHQALHDPLTGLPNRALFLDRLGVALDRSKRTKSGIAVLFLDVDNFKEINDSLGHAAGDMVLSSLAARLQAMLRPMDTVARFGGDEFTFLFEDLASEREVVLIAERISRTAEAPVHLDQTQALITASIGIATVSDPTTPPEAVIREADAAMYRAKELGRSRYELYDEASRERATRRLELEADLRGALERSELCLHYQPEVSLNGREAVLGFEALVRWQHPERGLIAPGDFIPLAEETGMIASIGQFVLERALRQVARWRRERPGMMISVNLSADQLMDAGFRAMLASALQTVEVSPEAICLEVSERAIARDPELAVRALAALKETGVRIAIDDYGSGSSPLGSLSRLPVDMLKIHESFVRGLGHDPREATVVGAVIDLGHALGFSVLAEGVETAAQLARLRELGCDYAQGYLFSPAVPEDEAGALLVRG